MISGTGSINPYAFSSGTQMGKLYVPVKSANVIYAQFDHVSGFAARHGERGVSLSKVQILNALIDHMAAMKREPAVSTSRMSDKQIDAMIENLQKQVQQAVNSPSAQYALSGAQPQAGVLFAIDA